MPEYLRCQICSASHTTCGDRCAGVDYHVCKNCSYPWPKDPKPADAAPPDAKPAAYPSWLAAAEEDLGRSVTRGYIESMPVPQRVLLVVAGRLAQLCELVGQHARADASAPTVVAPEEHALLTRFARWMDEKRITPVGSPEGAVAAFEMDLKVGAT